MGRLIEEQQEHRRKIRDISLLPLLFHELHTNNLQLHTTTNCMGRTDLKGGNLKSHVPLGFVHQFKKFVSFHMRKGIAPHKSPELYSCGFPTEAN